MKETTIMYGSMMNESIINGVPHLGLLLLTELEDLAAANAAKGNHT